MSKFRIVVPASSANLGPGFDCMGLALSLYNTLVVSPASSLQVEVAGCGQGQLATDASNLVWRAACHLWARVDFQEPKLRIEMHNGIPLASGLGSSSAAIVAGLMLANHLAGKPLSRRELLAQATELEGHPDNVAPALLGGLTIAITAAGEEIIGVKASFPADLQLVICVPGFTQSTVAARKVLPVTVSHADAVFNVSRVALLVAALAEADYSLLATATADRLHEPYRKELIPGFHRVKECARKAGAAATVISGAGPALLALVAPERNPTLVGGAMVAAFAEAGVEASFQLLKADLRGAYIQPVF